MPHKDSSARLTQAYTGCCETIREERGCAGGLLALSYDQSKQSPRIDLGLSFLGKRWKKTSSGFLRFFREHVLSGIFLVMFFLWNLVLPKEKKTKSFLGCAYERIGRLAKRSLDIVGASIGLILCLPLFLIIGILIKLDSPGSVIFKQERIGQNRRWRDRRNFSL